MRTMKILILSVFATVSISRASEEQIWPWNPSKDHLDIGKHADFTEIQGKHEHTIQILTDSQYKYLAIKDQHFNGCYLIDMKTAHMTAENITAGIKKLGVAVLPGEFDVKYPNIPHADIESKFGHRVAHFCRHNPTTWLVKHDHPFGKI